MLAAVQADTQISDQAFITRKLNKGQSYIANRIMSTNPELFKVTNDQITLAANTSSFDLGANVSTGELQQIEWLGIKQPGGTTFMEVAYTKGNDPNFIYWDQQQAQIVNGQLTVIDNYNKVRFAPPVPASSVLRVDYIYAPRTLSLATQTTCDLPTIFHECLVSDATRNCFIAIDDTRDGPYKFMAMDELQAALNVLNSRQFQQPFRTRPSSRRRERWVG